MTGKDTSQEMQIAITHICDTRKGSRKVQNTEWLMDRTYFSTYMGMEDTCVVSSLVPGWDLRGTKIVKNTYYDSGSTRAQLQNYFAHSTQNFQYF